MGFINTKLKAATLSGLAFISFATAGASEVGITPQLHANRCDFNLNERGFNVYRSKNCEKLFLAPNSIEKPINKIDLEGSISLCDQHNSLLEVVGMRVENLERANNYLNQALDEGNKDDIDYWEAKVDEYELKIDNSRSKYTKFASTHAATVRSVFKNEVTSDDVHAFNKQNLELFLTLSKNGIAIPDVEPIKTTDSIYSFVHYRPEDATEELKTIISTTIPGLEVLAQPTAQQTNVAHVVSNQAIIGRTEISLASACPMVNKNGNDWVVNPEKIRDFMTVKRTYKVPMKGSYTVRAKLHNDTMVKVLADLTIRTKNQGLSKTQIFNKTIETTGEEIFDIEYDEDTSFDENEKELITIDIQKKLLDRFLAIQESKGLLADLKPVVLEPPTGGFVDEVQWARRCWSKRRFFSSDSGCYDYSYTIKKWRDGLNYTDIVDKLETDIKVFHNITENKVFYYPQDTIFFDLSDVSTKKIDQEENDETSDLL